MENEKASSILDHIPTGRANAVHQTDLATKTGLTTWSVKSAIRQARKTNIILSGQEGYWLPESETEGEQWLNMMKKQAISRFVSMRHTRQQLRKDHNQLSLDDVGVV